MEKNRLVGTILFDFGTHFTVVLSDVCVVGDPTHRRYSSDAPKGWATWYIIFCFVISIALIALFIWVENRRGAQAMMPLKIWKYPEFGLVMFIMFFGWFEFEIMTLYMTYLLDLRRVLLISDSKTFGERRHYFVLCTSFQT